MCAAIPILIWLGGCDSVPGANIGTPSSVKVLDVLDPDFVRFEEERMPVDEFLFRMRQLGRRAGQTGEPLFGIRIVVQKPSGLLKYKAGCAFDGAIRRPRAGETRAGIDRRHPDRLVN